MQRITPQLRTHILFGQRHKTLIASGLVRSALSSPPVTDTGSKSVNYIQPFAGLKEDLNCAAWVLPEIAQAYFNHRVLYLGDNASRKPSDEEVRERLKETLETLCGVEEATTLIETDGGVLSPGPVSLENGHAGSLGGGWSTQADLYKELRIPAILVDDDSCASSTLTSLESLIMRGYDVHGIAIVKSCVSNGDDNLNRLREYCDKTPRLRDGGGGVMFTNVEEEIVSIPLPDADESLEEYYNTDTVREAFLKLHNTLDCKWSSSVNRYEDLRKDGLSTLWWPFTQHSKVNQDNLTLIDAAHGPNFSTITSDNQRKELHDSCCSWWTNGMGHGDVSLSLTAAAASSRYGHVIFPSAVHQPVVALSKFLLTRGPGTSWAERVFYSDDGSTALEVAIKMGFKMYRNRFPNEDGHNLVALAQEDCYHGDTLGCMDIATPSVFNEGQHPWYEPKGLFIQCPTVGYENGELVTRFQNQILGTQDSKKDSIQQVLNVKERMKTDHRLYSLYYNHISSQCANYHQITKTKIGITILEPILMGAGGMKFVDPLYQRALCDYSKANGIPLVYDEVFSGLHRLGVISCKQILDTDPDIAAYGKLLTGGLVPMGVTMASGEVFDCFLGKGVEDALLHGHSYTAYPLGCATSLHALESYDEILSQPQGEDLNRVYFEEESVRELSNFDQVQESFALGTVLVIKLQGKGGYSDTDKTATLVKNLRDKGVYVRPLGNVIYIMVSPLADSKECQRLSSILTTCFKLI